MRNFRLSILSINFINVYVILLLEYYVAWRCESIQFHFPSFSSPDQLSDIRVVQQDSSWYQGQDAVSYKSAFWLTPNPVDVQSHKFSNIGKFVYKDSIPFKSSTSGNKVFSFSTSFSFQIINAGPYDTCGSGMAFFISAFDKAPNNSDGKFLGLIDPLAASATPPKFFAVEFDTHTSSELNDSSASHIGIDVSSLISLNYTDTSPNSSSPFYPQLYLYSNYTFTAWVEYDSLTSLIQVWMTNASTSTRPAAEPCLQLSHDLSEDFDDFMYVGFSATNKVGEDGMEGHVVNSWSFTSEDLNKPTGNISKNTIVLITVLALFIIISSFSLTLFFIKRKRENCLPSALQSCIASSREGLESTSSHCNILPRYTYKELKRCAQNFSNQNKVGEGGYSSVYRGTLGDGSVVAIKRLKEGVQKEAEFSAEMNIISGIRHRNLLELQGWCYERGEAMLVYRYMSNGSLEKYLYNEERRSQLQSEDRLRILVGVASALEYMHGNLRECVLHRDVKAANVLLTEGFEPMLGDFGLARLVAHADQGAVTMTAVGTPGYVAPEVVYRGRATDKADVYSFGVLALETACGRRAILGARSGLSTDQARIVDYAWTLHQRDQLMEALDPCMSIFMDSGQREKWRGVLHVALMCCNPTPESRPSMAQVYQALKGGDTHGLLTQPLPESVSLYPTFSNWPSASGSSAFESSSLGWAGAATRSASDGALRDIEDPSCKVLSAG